MIIYVFFSLHNDIETMFNKNKAYAFSVTAILCFFLFFILASCGKTITEPPMNTSTVGIADETYEPVVNSGGVSAADGTPEEPLLSLEYTSSKVFPIIWDFWWRPGDNSHVEPDESEIIRVLNGHFNIEMETHIFKVFLNNLSAYADSIVESNGKLPDIISNKYFNAEKALEAGALRPIPWEMVEQFAPRYAAMLKQNPILYEKFRNPSKERDKYTLPSLVYNEEMLETLSVYRLDWLEAVGVTPNGNVVRVSEGVYFTEEAFSQFEFEEIVWMLDHVIHTEPMNPVFATSHGVFTPQSMILTGMDYDWFLVDPILGMFGLNTENIQENGSAAVWFSTEAFHSFVRLMLRLKETAGRDNLHYLEQPFGLEPVTVIGGVPGWSSVKTLSIFSAIEYIVNHEWGEGGKILLTPPEIGLNGQRGVQKTYEPYRVARGELDFFISADVGNEKFARILQIFDAVSFDPELYRLTVYGNQGEDFEWLGTPYESGVLKNMNSLEFTGVFTTGIIDGHAGKYLYDFQSEIIYGYITSDRASAMNIYPYKSDPYGIFDSNKVELEERYPYHVLRDAASVFYTDVLDGTKSLDTDWAGYLDTLSALGLMEWNAYYDGLP